MKSTSSLKVRAASQRGATFPEYMCLILLISLVAIGATHVVGQRLSSTFANIEKTVTNGCAQGVGPGEQDCIVPATD